MFYSRTKSYQRTGDVLEGWVCPEFHLKRCTLEDNDFWWYMIPESNYQSKHELKSLRTAPYTGVPYTTTFFCGVRCIVTKELSICGTEARDHLPSSLIPVLNCMVARPEKLLWLYTGITTQTLGTATDLLCTSRKQIFNMAKFSSLTLLWLQLVFRAALGIILH